jgi:glycolate oxidase FAD binding subunit
VSASDALSSLVSPEALMPSDDFLAGAEVEGNLTAVVQPASTVEVAAVMSWAAREGVGVLPTCSGERAPHVPSQRPYAVLSTKRLAGMELYEAGDLTLTAKAGTPLTVVDEAVREARQWAPFDPPHRDRRSIGGLVSCGESGPLWMGYGELRNHVLGMTVVTGDGRVLRLGGRVVKNVAGFDLLKPMVGSRGSLAVVTSVCLRVFPEPEVDRVLAFRAETLDSLVRAAQAVGTASVLPVSSVLIGRTEIFGDAALIVRLHGAPQTVDADQLVLENKLGVAFETLSDPGPVLACVSDHGADAPVVLSATTRPSTLPELVATLEALGPLALVIDSYAARARVGLGELDLAAIRGARESIERLGGAMSVSRSPAAASVEGFGSTRRAAELELTNRLQKTFDPAGVLWPARG